MNPGKDIYEFSLYRKTYLHFSQFEKKTQYSYKLRQNINASDRKSDTPKLDHSFLLFVHRRVAFNKKKKTNVAHERLAYRLLDRRYRFNR